MDSLPSKEIFLSILLPQYKSQTTFVLLFKGFMGKYVDNKKDLQILTLGSNPMVECKDQVQRTFFAIQLVYREPKQSLLLKTRTNCNKIINRSEASIE
jgi:hypothetical protein